MPNPFYPPGVTDRNLESDLHRGPDFDAIADERALEDDERSAAATERRVEEAEARADLKANR